MDDLSKIFPGFFIGSLPCVNRETLDNNQITHIVSILNGFKPKWKTTYTYLHIDEYDAHTTDIMKHFDQTFEFIDKGRKEGGVLVHCFAGISRSATICIAYIMRKLNISFEDAHGLLLDARPIIEPNSSFVKQLKKYEVILQNRRLAHPQQQQPIINKKPIQQQYSDEDSDEDSDYDDEDDDEEDSDEFDEEFDNVVKKDKKTKSKITITTATSTSASTTTTTILKQEETTLLEQTITAIESVSLEEDKKEEEVKEELGVHRYCCRKCSKDLFLDFDILDHEQGQGQVSFKWNKRDHIPATTITSTTATTDNLDGADQEEKNKIICTSYFITEIDFVLSQTYTGNGKDGKLFCLSCNEKLGSWCWSGEQCSCGAWIAPSFQIPKTRVDEKKVLTNNIIKK